MHDLTEQALGRVGRFGVKKKESEMGRAFKSDQGKLSHLKPLLVSTVGSGGRLLWYLMDALSQKERT